MNKKPFLRIAFCLLPLLLLGCDAPVAADKPQAAAAPSKADRAARLAKAEAMFAERCKTAGENIHRTADNVEGALLMKVRPDKDNRSDQFAMDDPYGRDSGGDEYLKSFFLESYLNANRHATAEMQAHIRKSYIGYLWIEAIDPKDGQRYRYTGSRKVVGKKDMTTFNNQVDMKRNPNFDVNIYAFVLDKAPAPGPGPRYGVTYDDISTREEREYWIAGSSLKVIDLKTNEVMAERIGYMMDRGQGNNSGGRSPWLMAADNACPKFGSEKPVIRGLPGASQQQGQTRKFVVKILKPKLEN